MIKVIQDRFDQYVLRELDFTDEQIREMFRLRDRIRRRVVHEDTRESLHLRFWRWLVNNRGLEGDADGGH